MWVPLVENGEYDKPGADYFVKERIDRILQLDPQIDTIILGCTHYPLLLDKIRKYTPDGVTIVPQGKYIAESLERYLIHHDDLRRRLTTNATCRYYTTESATKFRESASMFLHEDIDVQHTIIA